MIWNKVHEQGNDEHAQHGQELTAGFLAGATASPGPSSAQEEEVKKGLLHKAGIPGEYASLLYGGAEMWEEQVSLLAALANGGGPATTGMPTDPVVYADDLEEPSPSPMRFLSDNGLGYRE